HLDKSSHLPVDQISLADPAHLVEQYLGRVALEPSAATRAKLLRELSWLFESQVRDPARALTARLAAYREQPQRSAWSNLERVARGAHGGEEGARAPPATPGELPPADRAPAGVHIGGLCEPRLEPPASALAAYRRAVAADPDCCDAHLRLEALLRARNDH